MCKRYSLTATKEAIENQFDLSIEHSIKSSYNIAPSQSAYIITNEKRNQLQYITWGLVPHWSKDGANNGKLINARREGIAASTSFRIPIRRRRCLILADSYYEWKREGVTEYPYRIYQEEVSIMAFAGIWDSWDNGEHSIQSFSIITIPAPETISHVSDRCPLILEDKKIQQKWLDDIDLNKTLKIMGNNPSHLKCYPISKKVNSIKFNSIELHEEIAS